MPHSAAALAEALELAVSAKKQLSDLGGRLHLSIGDADAVTVSIPPIQLGAVPGVGGLFWGQLPCGTPDAPTCTKIIIGGFAGTHSERVRVPPAVRLRLNEGALLWWQESYGHDAAGEPASRRVEAPCDLHLAPDELHSFLVLEDYMAYTRFSPALT